MIRRVQVWPPSNETPSNSPLTGPGSVDIATMFDGLAGLMAMASSASLPGRWLMLKLAGTADAEPAGTTTTRSVATTSRAKERERVHDRLAMGKPPSNAWSIRPTILEEGACFGQKGSDRWKRARTSGRG